MSNNKQSAAQQAALAAQQAAASEKATEQAAQKPTDAGEGNSGAGAETTADAGANADAGNAAPTAPETTTAAAAEPAKAVVTDTSAGVSAKDGDATLAAGVRGVVAAPKPVVIANDLAAKTPPAMPKAAISGTGTANSMKVDVELLNSEMERLLEGVPAANRMQINGIVNYVLRCDPSTINALPSVINASVGLWHNIRLIINNEDKYFTKVFAAALRVFEIAGRGALSETHLYRGMDNIPLSLADRTAFADITTMMRVLAPVKTRKMMLQSSIKLSRSLRNGLTQDGINRVTAFFDAAQ